MTKRLFEMEQEQGSGTLEFNFLPDEHWADIKGYEGLYQISTYGRVRSMDRKWKRVEFLKFQHNTKGYPVVTLGDRNYRKNKSTRPIHRLVAETFIPNPNNLPEVNHKDEDKENNCIWNLEWCDHAYNIHYGTGIERNSEGLRKAVCQYDYDGNLLNIWGSVAEIAEWLGYDNSCIVRACNGALHIYKGYIWIYAEDANLNQRLLKEMNWVKDNPSYSQKRKVLQYTINGELIKEYDGVRAAERETGFSSSGICDSIKNKKARYGFLWQHS